MNDCLIHDRLRLPALGTFICSCPNDKEKIDRFARALYEIYCLVSKDDSPFPFHLLSKLQKEAWRTVAETTIRLFDRSNIIPVCERTSMVLPTLFLESPADPGKPVRCYLTCPACKHAHIDKGEWATKPHRTHLCEYCNHTWKPAEFPTVGVDEPYSCGK